MNDSGAVGIDDHARETRGIEHALFKIEHPRAVLLRHQAALQAVCQSGHRALQALQLRIEIGAQARQLFGIAEFVGGLHLVVDRGEGLVLRLEGVTVAPVGAQRRCRLLVVGLGRLHLGVGVIRGRHLDLVARLAFAGIARVLLLPFALAFTLAFALVGRLGLGFAFLVFLALLVVVLGDCRAFIAHAKIAQEIAHHIGECGLVVHRAAHARHGAGCLLRKFRAPVRRDGFGGGRKLASGHRLAQHEFERIVHRRAALVRHLGVSGALAALLKHGIEVLGDAIHGHRADRLDPRALGRLEQAARILALGHRLRVRACIVVGDAQGERIGLSAGAGGGDGRQILRRAGQRDLAILQAAAIDREIHGKLVLPRDGPRGGAEGGLEDVRAVGRSWS